MTRLTIYGDFNRPFSALASARADVLLAAGAHEIEWRAIQHDMTIPVAGDPVDGQSAAELTAEVATIFDLSGCDLRLHLVVPPVRSNTAVWAEGRNLGNNVQLDLLGAAGRDEAMARRWQEEFDALPGPVTPTLVLPSGYVSRGLGALARLAELAGAVPSSSPARNNP